METSKSVQKKILSGLFWKFGERITAQFVSLVVSIILARLLAPDDYGAVAIVMVFITIANVFVSNGFGNALIQKKDADNLDFSSVFYINLFISVILYLILFVIAPLIADFYHMPVLAPALRVLGLRIPVAGINTVQQAFVSRNMIFKRFFWSTLFGTVISGAVGLVMAYQGYGVWALIAQYLTNTCTDTLVLWITVRWRPDFKCSWKRAGSLLNFGWKLLVAGLLDTGYKQLRNLIIGKKYTNSDLAFYNQGEKYPNLIVVNINASISSVMFPALSRFQEDRTRMKQMTRRAIQVSSYVMWPLMLGLAVIAEPLIKIVLTEKWLPCVPYLRVFCFSYGLWPIHTANLQALNALGRSDLFMKLEIIKKGIGLIILIASMQISPFAMALSLIAADIISIFINAAPNIKLLEYSYLEQLADLLSPLFMALGMAVIVYPISFLSFHGLWVMILQICAGAAVYLIESVCLKHAGFQYLLHLFKTKRGK